jgi:hypothetical protein
MLKTQLIAFPRELKAFIDAEKWETNILRGPRYKK